MSPDLARFGDVPGVLENHRMKDDKPLRNLSVPTDSCESRGQQVNKAAPDSPDRSVVSSCRNERQVFPTGIPLLVILDAPTEVRYIVGVQPVSVDLLDTPVLPHGSATRQIPRGPLAVPLCGLIFICCHCLLPP